MYNHSSINNQSQNINETVGCNNYNLFYTKYGTNDRNDRNSTFRGRFRSFQTSAYGNG